MSDNATEILKSAILLERRGKAFYTQVAEQAKSPEVKDVFQAMAKEEDLHIEQLSKQFAHYQKNKTFMAPSKPAEAIHKAVLNPKIRGDIQAAGYEAAAISAAMAMEERAVKLYSDRAAAATDANEKALYKWLADWEKDHVKLLVEFDRELTERVWTDNHFWPF
jgi:rubrerythrin